MFKELVKQNRSYRGYDESYKVSKEELKELIEYARITPSTMNQQPFQYYLAVEAEKVKQIEDMVGWAGSLPFKLPRPGKSPTAFIIICQNTDWVSFHERYKIDVGIVAQTLLLAAAEKGLGGCMFGSFKAENVKQQLNFSENLEPMLVISIGKPAEEIELVNATKENATKYYRDEEDTHYVPKRKLEDIVIM
jgi:Nitroreductase